jgi:hypothetical protein
VSTDDYFEELLPAKWRGVEFPVTRTRMSIAHDLVEHKYWGVDGARIESTGLAPRRYTFTSPLMNTIWPGRSEKWAALYPNQLRALIGAFQQKSVGVLQHIEFGAVKCKAEHMDVDWDAARRGGVDAELTFVETLAPTDEEVENDILASRTPIAEVDIGSVDLDKASTKADLEALLEAKGLDLPPYLLDKNAPISLGELANKIKSVTDYPGLLSYRAAGQINALVYHANRIKESASSARSALTWPVVQNAERIKAAAHELTQDLLTLNKSIAFFTVPADTTLAGVARQIPAAKISDLIKLNPALMKGPEIQRGTVVRYYVYEAAA